MAWDDEFEQWFFSVTDVVQVLTDSEDVKQYIKKMRRRDPELNAKWGTICTPVEFNITHATECQEGKRLLPIRTCAIYAWCLMSNHFRHCCATSTRTDARSKGRAKLV